MKISAFGEDAQWELSVFLEYEDGHKLEPISANSQSKRNGF
jgi:hypothetical protein